MTGTQRSLPSWKQSHSYDAGQRVTWESATLECCVKHDTSPAALNPWDPSWSWGWTAAEARTLWRPVGIVSRLIVGLRRRRGVIR